MKVFTANTTRKTLQLTRQDEESEAVVSDRVITVEGSSGVASHLLEQQVQHDPPCGVLVRDVEPRGELLRSPDLKRPNRTCCSAAKPDAASS